MTIDSETAKVQHYVPQFVLKHFCEGKNPQIFVFDKEKENVFRTNIKNVACENGFYNFCVGDGQVSIEPLLGNLETAAANVIKKISRDESLATITLDERLSLSTFIAVQFIRTKNVRLNIALLNKTLEEKLTAMGMDHHNVDGFKMMDENDVKTLSARLVLEADEFVPHIYGKAWILFKTTRSHPFFIGDNPVTLQNRLDFGPYGNLGLAVKGVEIYFPICSTLTLAIFCKSHEEVIRDTHRKIQSLMNAKIDLSAHPGLDLLRITELMAGIEKGNSVQSHPKNVINHNSLQIRFASRFVFSSNDDFALVKEMIADNPMYKRGIQMQVS
jgi:hypothetical protein